MNRVTFFAYLDSLEVSTRACCQTSTSVCSQEGFGSHKSMSRLTVAEARPSGFYVSTPPFEFGIIPHYLWRESTRRGR